MLPQRIGRYDVSAELGRGATSIVFKGVDPADGRVVAIKTLQRSSADDDAEADSILLRFRNEARAIGRLRHPGVVAIDEYGEDGLHSWIAMEYVEGRTLDDLLLRSPLLGQERALALMDELLEALGCVHREGICHRDLKPANIMVTPAGRVKLMDFGVARLRDLGLTRVSSIIGTPAFMAPEQFTGGALDHRADLFACGVLLFLLLSGRRPFSGGPASVMHQILHEEPPLLSAAAGGAVGRAFDALVVRALAKHPGQRFASADDMRDALRDAALEAAAAPLATLVGTVVGTLVQDAARPGLADDERVLIRRAPAHLADAMAPMIRRDGAAQARLVDALSLYAPEADPVRPPADAAVLPSAICDAARQVLARRLGPVAGVLVRRTAEAAGASPRAFVAALLAGLSEADRAALRTDLEALAAPIQRADAGR
jgi:eukaryotic-like serine/threonine-protein kinase